MGTKETLSALQELRYRSTHVGEIGLWLCVLKDAILCACGKVPATAKGQKSKEDYEADKQEEIKRAQAWFKSDNTMVGSYLWVCDVLGYDAGKLRELVEVKYGRLPTSLPSQKCS